MKNTMYRTRFGVAGAAVLVLALQFLAGPALANQCVYSDGNHDNGPCVEVRNELVGLIGSFEMNLWCHNGPTKWGHKIVLKNHPDSFTCRGVVDERGRTSTTISIQRTQIGCDYCDLTYDCRGKLVLTLSHTAWRKEQLVLSGCVIR